MEFVESTLGVSAEPWSDAQEALAKAVGQATKRYFEATADLLIERYQQLRDVIPAYLSKPGSVLTAICDDGVVIRYEKRSEVEPKKVIAVMRESITEVAAMLSQNLVHIATLDTPFPPSETFGVEMRLQAVSPAEGATRDLAVSRIWFQVQNGIPPAPKQLGAKPYCLLSVRNQLEVELHGIMGAEGKATEGGKPFIARSALRLDAGWECIEVFPAPCLDDWNPDFAPLWAERDILGAALVARTKDAHLASLDPRASARRLYAEPCLSG